MQAVILAAGKGTRLHPLTATRSKALMPVAGKPMVARVMETLVVNGVHDFVLVVSEHDQEIVPYFREQTSLKVHCEFVVQPEQLGMANALSLAAPYLHEPFVLSACDNIVPADHLTDLIETFRTQNANAALSLMEVSREKISKTGIVEWRFSEIISIIEKPTPEEAPSNISSLPLYVFTPRLLDYLPRVSLSPRGEYELQDAIQMLIDEAGGVTGVITKKRMQLTDPADLLTLNRHYLSLIERPYLRPESIGAGTQLVTPLRIDPGVTIGPNCQIGPHVYLEANCRIGSEVTLREAVVFQDAIVRDEQVVIGEVVD